jgi:hypothetical protein
LHKKTARLIEPHGLKIETDRALLLGDDFAGATALCAVLALFGGGGATLVGANFAGFLSLGATAGLFGVGRESKTGRKQ